MINIAILDDECLIVKTLKKYCNEFKFVDKILGETCAEKFLDDLDDNKFDRIDCFLLDIEMDIQGDEVAKEIKSKYPSSQIIFISGYDRRGNISFNNSAIISGVIDKPIKKAVLSKMLYDLDNIALRLKVYKIDSTSSETIFFSTKDIIAITTDERATGKAISKNYIALILGGVIYKHQSSLTAFIKKYKVEDYDFIKISGSTYLNRQYVKKYSSSGLWIEVKNGTKFNVSRVEKEVFKLLNDHISL